MNREIKTPGSNIKEEIGILDSKMAEEIQVLDSRFEEEIRVPNNKLEEIINEAFKINKKKLRSVQCKYGHKKQNYICEAIYF